MTAPPTLTTTSGIHVLNLGADENRFGPDWLTAAEAALNQVVAAPAPLITIADGKFYSNGLDLEWVGANPDQFLAYAARVEALLARILTLPVPTVAAVNGHAFGAGAMFAMAHDWRIMRADRGYFCFPEVDINIPFTPGMAALIQAKLSARSAVDSMTTGQRYTGADALAIGLVDATADEAALLDTALAKVADLHAKAGDTLGAIKATMFADVARLLTSPPASTH
jgi:enoyl-CoA hydratase/carnithine racemase